MYSCNALEYVLETFTEKRSIACNYAACSPGQTIDGISAQSTLPNPWLMSAQPSQQFANSGREMFQIEPKILRKNAIILTLYLK